MCACDTLPLWVRLGYLAYAGLLGSDGVSDNLTIGIQCEIVLRTQTVNSNANSNLKPEGAPRPVQRDRGMADIVTNMCGRTVNGCRFDF